MFPPANLPVSKPCNPVKDGVSQNISIIFNVASDGFGGAGPPPVFFCSFLNPLNSFLAVLWRFFVFDFLCSPEGHSDGVYG